MAAIINIIVLILKSNWCHGWFGKRSALVKRILIIVLGQVFAILTAIIGGTSWTDAIISGLISSGGAMAIWEVIKPIFVKKL